MKHQEKYAVIFGGGGSRGAYEAGAWKAIQEAGIPVGLIVGSSIGAINTVLTVQGADVAELYKTITLQDVIPDPSLNSSKDIFELENLFKTVKGVIKNKGYSTDSLRTLLDQFIDFEKISSSEIDLGIVTCTTPFAPIIKFKEDINSKEELLDLVLASSGFPIFKRTKVDGKKCIDGGFWNNVPTNIAIEKGYRKIIAIDLSSVGMKKPTKKVDGLDICMIKVPRNSLGGLFEIKEDLIKENIEKGYFDTKEALKEIYLN